MSETTQQQVQALREKVARMEVDNGYLATRADVEASKSWGIIATFLSIFALVIFFIISVSE